MSYSVPFVTLHKMFLLKSVTKQPDPGKALFFLWKNETQNVSCALLYPHQCLMNELGIG